jgi:hypothetical protein
MLFAGIQQDYLPNKLGARGSSIAHCAKRHGQHWYCRPLASHIEVMVNLDFQGYGRL